MTRKYLKIEDILQNGQIINENWNFAGCGIKRSRSEGSILDASEIGTCKSMGGSDGNLSQCSLQSSKTRKSNDIIIDDDSGTIFYLTLKSLKK